MSSSPPNGEPVGGSPASYHSWAAARERAFQRFPRLPTPPPVCKLSRGLDPEDPRDNHISDATAAEQTSQCASGGETKASEVAQDQAQSLANSSRDIKCDGDKDESNSVCEGGKDDVEKHVTDEAAADADEKIIGGRQTMEEEHKEHNQKKPFVVELEKVFADDDDSSLASDEDTNDCEVDKLFTMAISPLGPGSVIEDRRLCLGNLAYSTNEGDLHKFFKGYLVESLSLRINARTSRPVTYAIVELATPVEAQRAITELSGRKLARKKVSICLPRWPENSAKKVHYAAASAEAADSVDVAVQDLIDQERAYSDDRNGHEQLQEQQKNKIKEQLEEILKQPKPKKQKKKEKQQKQESKQRKQERKQRKQEQLQKEEEPQKEEKLEAEEELTRRRKQAKQDNQQEVQDNKQDMKMLRKLEERENEEMPKKQDMPKEQEVPEKQEKSAKPGNQIKSKKQESLEKQGESNEKEKPEKDGNLEKEGKKKKQKRKREENEDDATSSRETTNGGTKKAKTKLEAEDEPKPEPKPEVAPKPYPRRHWPKPEPKHDTHWSPGGKAQY